MSTTLAWWAVRTVVSMALVAGTAWAVSFFVSDYVTKASVTPLTAAVQNLQTSMNELSSTVRAVDQDLKAETRRFRDDRQQLAEDIARRAAELQVKMATTGGELAEIRLGIARIESRMDKAGYAPAPR